MQANNAKQAAQQKKDWRGLRQRSSFPIGMLVTAFL